jgi:MoaA/NifB/PqqE/SkfB family radical SAM enzyme
MKIPKSLSIETVYGCNARCIMCPIDYPAKRKKQIMSSKMYKYIIDSMAKYVDDINMLNLFGLGEPFLDPQLLDRIRYELKKIIERVSD